MLEDIKTEIAEFHRKFGACKLENETDENNFIAGEDIVLRWCEPNAQSEEERHELAKFCNFLGCWLLVFTYRLKEGRMYYQKALALYPDSFDIHWEYYTTLEEIVEDEMQCTPEFIQDAIDCLRFCIDYCDTPELMSENHIEYRWLELGRVYLIAKEPAKARRCAKMSMKLQKSGKAKQLLDKADKELGFFGRIRAMLGII